MKSKTINPPADSIMVETAQLKDQIATMLMPNLNDGQKLAIVDEGVLKYLTALLPTANSRDILRNFIELLRNLLSNGSSGDDLLLETVREAKDFVAFHTSVNLLTKYFDPKIMVEYKEPFNKIPEPLTLPQMVGRRTMLAQELADLDASIQLHPDYQEEIPEVHTEPMVAPNAKS